MGAWGSWPTCSVTCGSGTKTRTRSIITQKSGNGAACKSTSEQQACATGIICPVNCVMGAWGSWTTCTKNCGTGTQTRTRSVKTHKAGSGAPCGSTSQQQNCNTNICPVDCVVGEWGSWSTCTKNCGTGMQTRTKRITTQQAGMGAACGSTSQEQNCNTNVCPVDCVV